MPIGSKGPFGLPGGAGPNLATEFALPRGPFADGVPAPPNPQDSQWMFASRNWDQPQPWFGRMVFAAAVVASIPSHQFFAAPQQSPEQVQPQFWRQQLDLVSLAAGQSTYSPQQTEQDRQPWFSKGIFPSIAQTPTPNEQFFAAPQQDPTQIQPWFTTQQPPTLSLGPRTVFASPQSDPSQIQPWFIGQTIGQRVPTPLVPLWTAAPQADPTQLQPTFSRQLLTSALASPVPFTWGARPQDDVTQLQPQIWRQQLVSAAVSPVPFQWTTGPQADPTQIQPRVTGQVPPSQATQTPPTPQWFAFPQADTTQIQPAFFPVAFIPSFTPIAPVILPDGLPKRKKRFRIRIDEKLYIATEAQIEVLAREMGEKATRAETPNIRTADKKLRALVTSAYAAGYNKSPIASEPPVIAVENDDDDDEILLLLG